MGRAHRPAVHAGAMTHATRWAAFHGRVAGQAGVATVADAIAVGIPATTYYDRVRREQWVSMGATAHLVPGAPWTASARRHAALIVLGPRAALSHRTALDLHELSQWGDPDGYVHALVPYGSTTRPPTMTRRHRSRRLDERDVTSVGGFPTTTVARTLLDVSPSFGQWRLEAMMLQARQRNALAPGELLDQHGRRPTVRGAARFRGAIDVLAEDVDSILEARALEVIVAHALPQPVLQYPIRHRGRLVRADFAWPGRRVVLECDGRAFHGDGAFQRDRDRWNHIKASGHDLRWATWTDIHERPLELAARIRDALTR